MALIATVITDGIHVRDQPTKTARSLDALTHGDQFMIDPTTAPVREWRYGRISRIANHVYELERTKVQGWMHCSEDYVTFHDDSRIPPMHLGPEPDWVAFLVGGFILAAGAGVLALIYYWR